MDGPGAHHRRTRLGLALLTLALTLSLARPVAAAETPCRASANVAAISAAGPDDRVSALPSYFQPTAAGLDREALLHQAQRLVSVELQEVGAPACYLDQVSTVAARTAFLSPFEFVVVGYFDRDQAMRAELLRLYREDPQAALRRAANFWPSPRAEMLLRTPAFFDIDADQIFVNLGAVTPQTAPNVVTHEFWHALASVRVQTTADGTVSRTTGFWTEQRPAGVQAWRPVEEAVADGIPTYLMNEAVAIEMEVAATGRQHGGMRPDLVAAVDALHELFAVAGREHVLQLYLESRSDELKRIAGQAAVAVGPRPIRLDARLLGAEPHPCGPGCCCHATIAAHAVANES